MLKKKHCTTPMNSRRRRIAVEVSRKNRQALTLKTALSLQDPTRDLITRTRLLEVDRAAAAREETKALADNQLPNLFLQNFSFSVHKPKKTPKKIYFSHYFSYFCTRIFPCSIQTDVSNLNIISFFFDLSFSSSEKPRRNFTHPTILCLFPSLHFPLKRIFPFSIFMFL